MLLLNGADDGGFSGDTRTPQIVDFSGEISVTSASAPADDECPRGYHSFALLLKDGRVLVGGGTYPHGDIGCERPDLRIYNPPYFAGRKRPEIVGVTEPIEAGIGGPKISIGYADERPRAASGVVLMALGAFTHGFDQNQRYVRLDFEDDGNGHVTVTPPVNANSAPVGDYIILLRRRERSFFGWKAASRESLKGHLRSIL